MKTILLALAALSLASFAADTPPTCITVAGTMPLPLAVTSVVKAVMPPDALLAVIAKQAFCSAGINQRDASNGYELPIKWIWSAGRK